MNTYKHKRNWLSFMLVIGGALMPGAVGAHEPFPSMPIHLIVPTVGGTVDLIARIVGTRLSEAWGQPVVIEQKAGASGNIAAEMVARKAADGYTILISYNPLVNSRFLSKELSYNKISDLAPITLATLTPQILVVNSSVPVSNIHEFIAMAKAKPNTLNYASIAPDSASHMTMELFKTRAAIKINHVPYKGAAPAINDLLGKNVEAGFFGAANVIEYVKAKQLRALAVTGRKRLRSLPNVPTVVESGFPDFDATLWIGFLAPAQTPAPIIEKYNHEIIRILELPEVRSQLEALDFEVVGSTPAAFGDFIRSETAIWSNVAKEAHMLPE